MQPCQECCVLQVRGIPGTDCALIVRVGMSARSKACQTMAEQSEDVIYRCNMLCSSRLLLCRVSPMQKAAVTKLVQAKCGAVTLGIGDGANDVGMIQVRHCE